MGEPGKEADVSVVGVEDSSSDFRREGVVLPDSPLLRFSRSVTCSLTTRGARAVGFSLHLLQPTSFEPLALSLFKASSSISLFASASCRLDFASFRFVSSSL